jgi:glycolate oxidase iron-sulfur subunit
MTRVRSETTPAIRSLKSYQEEISHCVKCGSCGGVCPTYLYERNESYSARGRMALIDAVLNGRLEVSRIYKDRLATCTTCLACEAACPSNVPVTEIIQAAKEQVVAESGRGIVGSVIAGLVKRPALFRVAARFAPVMLHYSKRPGSRVKEQRLRNAEGGVRNEKKVAHKAKGRVAFFPGCAIEYFQRDIEDATIGVLNAIGYDVIVPADVQCCGRPLLSLGDRRAAEGVAAHNTALFAALQVDAIVTACASCGLTFKKEYPELLPPGATIPVVLDIHDFLSDRIGGSGFKPVSTNVTIHDPCHLGRGQGLSRTVRDLLQIIPGLTIVEMKDADRCCGFGGVMRLTHREVSDGIADEKITNIIATGASTVVTGCPGCRMQITDALRRHASKIEVVHPMQLLEEVLLIADQE